MRVPGPPNPVRVTELRFFRTFLAALLAVAALYLAFIVVINPRGDFAGTRFPWLYANTRKMKGNLFQRYAAEEAVELVSFGFSRQSPSSPPTRLW